MARNLKDAVVVITGASSGIGRATALAFADKGTTVVVAARRDVALDDLVAEIERNGGKALAVPTDVTDEQAVQRLADRTVERFGKIDVWVNDAAVMLFHAPRGSLMASGVHADGVSVAILTSPDVPVTIGRE